MSAIHEMMNYTFVSRYSQWLEEHNRRETWKEAVDRNRDMMLDFYSDKNVEQDINWAYDFLEKKKVLGSQRNLQFGGKAVLSKNARSYNCVGSYCDRLQFFSECFWLLLCGCGTGFSVQKHHIDRLPPLTAESSEEYLNRPTKDYIIPDTIEGWSDSLAVLLTCYFDIPVYDRLSDFIGKRPIFKYNKIRPKGAKLGSGIGKAPGPDGLKNSIKKIDSLLLSILKNKAIEIKHSPRLRPINAYDIVMHTSDAVLSGGVRRSATLCLFSHDDEEMIQAKTGNWLQENPQRARSNNSVALLRSKTTFEQFENLIKYTREQYGEPGFLWLEDLEFMVNPCVEIQFWCYLVENKELFESFIKTYDKTGFKCRPEEIGLKSGWQACNLSSVKCAQLKDKEDFYERCKAAAIIGTCQAGYTSFDYLGQVSEEIIRREALLGVSLNGVMENPDIVLDEETQQIAATLVKSINKEFAKKIGINAAARATCVKPEGSSATMLGISSGIHPHHSKRYLRRIQANTTEPIYKHFKSINPIACDKSVWSNNNTDDVVSFPIEIPDGAKTKNQTPALELLGIVKLTQQNWVKFGKDEQLCTRPELEHNVSNTIVVMDEEWGEVTKFIYENRNYFCGISLISHSGDKDYAQAPFTTVYTPREIVKEYGDAALWTSGLIELALQSFTNLWQACDFVLIEEQQEKAKLSLQQTKKSEPYMELSNKIRLIEKIENFANKYFDGDVRRLTYCMKDVYNWKLYCDISREFKPVDYTILTENEDNTTFESEAVCAGGACLI